MIVCSSGRIAPQTTHDHGNRALVEAASVARVHRLRLDAEEVGELLDHNVEDEVAELAVALGPGEQRAAVDDESGGRGRAAGVAGVGRSRHGPGEGKRDAVV